MRKRRQRTGNNWPGIDKEREVLERLEDVAVEIKKKREQEERPWFLYPETRHNPPSPFPLISPPALFSLPSISPPLNFPLLVTTATGEGQKTKGDEGREKCSDWKLSQLQNSMFLQICCTS